MTLPFFDKIIKEGGRSNYRLIFSFACILYFVFGLFINILNPSINDPLWIRLLLSLLGLLTVAFSYNYKWVAKNFELLLTTTMFAFNAHFYYLLLVNDFNPGYKLGLLVGVVSTLIFINNRKIFSTYIAFNVIEYSFLVILTDQFTWSNTTLGFLIFTVLILGYLTNYERQSAFQKLRSNEALLKSINNNVLQGIYRINTSNTLVYCNEHFLSLLGFDRESEVNEEDYPIRFAQKAACNSFLRSIEMNKPIRNKEVLLRKKQGKVFWAILSQTPVYGANGEVIYYDGSIIDISHQKKTEKDLKIFSAAINYSPSSVIILEKDGCIKYANPEFLNFLQIDSEKVTGHKIWEFGLKGDKNLKALVQKINNNESWKGEINFVNNNNEIKTHLANIAPIMGKKNQVLNYVLVSEDITDMKQKERELNFAKELAEEASKTKERFLSTMSHELRTPMNAVIGCTNLLLEEKPKDSQLENLNILKFSANNLLAIINDILDLSKIDSGKITLAKNEFYPEKTLKKIERLHSISARKKGVELSLEIEKELPKCLIGDADRLNQILNNLLSNAIKFTHEGRVRVMTEFKQKENNEIELQIEVSDSGIGIPKDKLSNIFESFTQVHSRNKKLYGGTGLGLTITKKLIDLLGGKIYVNSKKGKGTTFTFSIPYLIANENKSLKITAEDADASPQDLKGYELLLVEDNPVNQKIASRFLEKWGLKLTYAFNGKEALEHMTKKSFNIVLMDLQMPIMDGYQATREIRSHNDHSLSSTPVIALSASATMQEKKRAIDSGVDHYITKPFKPKELRASIAKMLRKKIVKA